MVERTDIRPPHPVWPARPVTEGVRRRTGDEERRRQRRERRESDGQSERPDDEGHIDEYA